MGRDYRPIKNGKFQGVDSFCVNVSGSAFLGAWNRLPQKFSALEKINGAQNLTITKHEQLELV